MILLKFESHHLDLHIWSYKIHKTTSKLNLIELAYDSIVTNAWDPCVSRARWSVRQNRGDGMRRRGSGEARRRQGLQRWHQHDCDLQVPPNLLSSLARPIAGANYDGGVDGGTVVRLRSETPVLAAIA